MLCVCVCVCVRACVCMCVCVCVCVCARARATHSSEAAGCVLASVELRGQWPACGAKHGVHGIWGSPPTNTVLPHPSMSLHSALEVQMVRASMSNLSITVSTAPGRAPRCPIFPGNVWRQLHAYT